MTLIAQTIELVLVINVLIHAICMILVAKMPSAKQLLTGQYVGAQMDGLEIHTQSAINVGV